MAGGHVKTPPLALEDAQARLLALATPLAVEHVAVDEALGRFLAAPMLARRTQPAADLSAMDGYAVMADDLAGPWQVVGESAAGHPWSARVARGTAVRISTGALLPPDAGAVIVQEDVVRSGNTVTLSGEAPRPPGKHIRRRGLDFHEFGELLPAGARIGAAQIALAVAAGHAILPVRRRPRVVVIDSGDELAPATGGSAAHQIPASNGPMLSAMIAAALPCDVRRIGPVADRLTDIAAAFDAAADADVIVSTGGASVGDHDLVQPALESLGARIEFWRVAIKPGKPLLVARRDSQIIAGLPGNPVSGFVTAFLFLLPLLRALSGAARCVSAPVPAKLAHPLPAAGERREFLRANWEDGQVSTQSVQDSSALLSLARCNALLARPAVDPPRAAGETVPVFLLENGGNA